MSALDFLTPSAPAGADVLARSPMERLAGAAGARFEVRDGWNVPVGFGDAAVDAERIERSVGFADRSWLVKLEVSASAEAVAGLELSPGVAELRDGAWWCPVTSERVLVLGEPAAGGSLRAR